MGRAGVIVQTFGVMNIEMSIKATRAHMYQQELAAQSAMGPATVHPHRNLLVPGQEL